MFQHPKECNHMVSLKGILKYAIYIFIAGWMFFLGIMVGRGTSPVTFDTEKFQKRLETIAGEFGKKKKIQKEIDLRFYDILDRPAPENIPATFPSQGGNIVSNQKENPVKINDSTASTDVPEKKSKKNVTQKTVAGPVVKAKSTVGKYTIQIAAYKDFKDAVTHMADLGKKGFNSYREMGEKNGVTWYRIRIGPFSNYNDAKMFKQKLDEANIKSLIIKKDNHENIKG